MNSSRHIWDVQVFSPSEAYALCLGGNTSYLWHSSDSGKTWAELANGGSTMRRMEFFGTNEAWFYGLNNNIYKAPLASSVQTLTDFDGQLYPNPFQTSFALETAEPIDQFQLLDSQGRLLQFKYQLAAGRHEIDTENLPKGLYFVRLRSKSAWFVRKMVKN